MKITDLIKPPHLKFLGDVGCGNERIELHGDKGWWVLNDSAPGLDFPLSYEMASCILEHAIRVKLLECEQFVSPVTIIMNTVSFEVCHTRFVFPDATIYKTEPEALIAAMDALIEKEEKDAN